MVASVMGWHAKTNRPRQVHKLSDAVALHQSLASPKQILIRVTSCNLPVTFSSAEETIEDECPLAIDLVRCLDLLA